MKIIISAGGTRCPIDSVRYIGNSSKGKTGALLADYLIGQGEDVVYIHGKDAHLPSQPCVTREITTPEDYQAELLAQAKTADIAILSMAVSDYAPVKQHGKIRSDKEKLTLELYPTPKVITGLRAAFPSLFIVGFKLLAEDATQLDLINAGYDLVLKNKLNLAVLNRVDQTFHAVNTGILTPEKNYQPIKRADLPRILYQRILARRQTKYFHTEATNTLPAETPPEALAALKSINALGIFPPYRPDVQGSPTFGFVAYKNEDGLWITGRGSNKSEDSFVNVKEVAGGKIVVSGQKKASLNAYIAQLLFDRFPGRKFCVHFHHKLENPWTIPVKETTPGSLDDADAVEAALHHATSDTIGVYQEFHGTTLCLDSPSELEALLTQQNCCATGGDNYDICYARFHGGQMLERIKDMGLDQSAKIWDLAGGTGLMATQLRDLGFQDITIIDQSHSMLDAAKAKLGDAAKYRLARMQYFETVPDKPDLICIRQAINYLLPAEIGRIISGLLGRLNPGGRLLINTFVNPDMQSRSTHDTVETHENNTLDGNIITHGQYTTNWETGETFYDINKFFNITEVEWKAITERFQCIWRQNGSSLLLEFCA